MATAAESILELFKSKKYCDITFKVRQGTIECTFSAHRTVLSIWSPVFANKFQKNKNTFDAEIEIVDIRLSVFQAFLNYLYGSTRELEQNESDVKFVVDLYEAASRYQVQKLKTHCYEILVSSSPNQDNVFNLIDSAVLINSESLKERCFNVLQSETDSIINSLDLQDVTPSMVLTLLQLPSLWLTSEYELLTWVFSWLKSHCEKLQGTKSPGEIINSFLPYLYFKDLESKEFAILVGSHREFFDEVDCFKIFMNIHLPGSTELPVWYSINKREYEKSTQKATNSALIGDFAAELSYSVNNSTCSNLNTSNYEETGNKTDNIGQADAQVDANDVVGARSNGNSSVSLGVESSNDLSSSSVNDMTDVAMNTNSKEATSSNDNSSITLDVETTTTSNDTSSLLPTVDNMTDVAININKKEATSSNENSPRPLDVETSTTTSNDSSSLLTVDNMTDLAMGTNNDEATLSDDDSSVSLSVETSTISNNNLSLSEETERGQENSAVLEKIDQELGKSWDSLEPPAHWEKIKKKKVMKLYLLPESKSLPNIGVWDSALEPLFLTGNFKSLNDYIEKQLNIPVAAEVIDKYTFKFPPRKAPVIF